MSVITQTVSNSQIEYFDISDNNIGNNGIAEFCGAIRSER